MLFHRMESRDIRINLATEDYLMSTLEIDEPILLMYIQNPCLIVGNHQNIYEEVAVDQAIEDGIIITRRLSGGGTVFDDLGNVSFSFVVKKDQLKFGDYTTITQPIVEALKAMGVDNISINGRNDLFIEGKKISGNAMYTKNQRTFSHGTLLFDVDLKRMEKYLIVSKEKIKTNHIQSVKARVTNIKPYLTDNYHNLTIEEFRDELIRRIFKVDSIKEISSQEIILSQFDQEQIQKSVSEIYSHDDWVYGHHQIFDVKRKAYIKNVGLIEVSFTIEKGKIEEISFSGDYFSQKSQQEVCEKLKGKRLIFNELMSGLIDIDIELYFSGLDKESLILLLLGELVND